MWTQETSAVEQQRARMLAALGDWDRSDANLERDAFRLTPAEALSRIEVTEQKRLALNVALSRYSETLRASFRARRTLLKSDTLTFDLAKEIHRQNTSDAQAALALVDAQERRLKLSDRARREELGVNRTQLNLILQGLDKHGAELAGEASPELLQRARPAVLSDVLQLETAVEVKDPTDWAQTYSALRGEVKRRATGATSQVASAAPIIGSAQLVVPTLAGVWAYSNPSAQKKGDIYQWKAARAEITQDGDRVDGAYECIYAVPEGEKLNPIVKFRFTGQIRSEVMVFQLAAPLKGRFQIVRQSAAEMSIAYFIENANKHGISFGEIPADSPQRLGRQAQ